MLGNVLFTLHIEHAMCFRMQLFNAIIMPALCTIHVSSVPGLIAAHNHN